MPLVLAPLLVGALTLLAAVAVLGLHVSAKAWLQALADSFSQPRSLFWKILRASGLGVVVSGTIHIFNYVEAALSRSAAAGLPMTTAFLSSLAVLAKESYATYNAVAGDVADALFHLRHTTMPREIAKKVTPVRLAAAAAGALAGKSISLGQKDRRDFTRGIDRLKKQLGPIAALLLGADLFIFGKHARTHHYHHTHTIPGLEAGAARVGSQVGRLGRVQARHESLLRKLAKLLTIAGFGALLWRVLLRWKLGWLRCSKVGRVGRFLCGMHSGLLDFLLGLGGAMFVFAELCQVIETVASVAARVLPKLIAPLAVVGAALCDGRHSAAPALPLRTTTLPTVDNPLPL